MIQWDNINTVLLDMDGTLLDLHFDNHFWQEHVPLRYSEKHSMDVDSAKEEIYPRFKAAEGTMDWYCLDYWSKQLDLNVAQLKLEVDHLIAIHPHVVEFLDAVRNSGRSLILVTNAHIDSLSLKMEKTSLQGHFDQLICAHDYGMPKEDPQFWNALKQQVNYDPKTTLLVDDSLPVLKSARRYGIQYLLAVLQPDSKSPEKDVEDFTAIRSFADIMPA
ncbi:MAG: GMP/IMP nucleotidase [Gammaproteobacteria bacterium]|nr:GMP/IMP nucleotidase [Gammaproteobacteria bacterium]MDH5803060.1 GMP/IMP nucleotidase [Gammaproteobacteria bacterium]